MKTPASRLRPNFIVRESEITACLQSTLADKGPLKDKSEVGMFDDKIQENTIMNGLPYFFHCSSPSPCEITHSIKRSKRNDVISRKQKQGWLLASRLLVAASLFIVLTFKKMAT